MRDLLNKFGEGNIPDYSPEEGEIVAQAFTHESKQTEESRFPLSLSNFIYLLDLLRSVFW